MSISGRLARRSIDALVSRGGPLKRAGLWVGEALLSHVLAERRGRLTASARQTFGARVVRGPFAGMVLPGEHSWLDGDALPKLLGTYEEELHSVIGSIIRGQGYDRVVNIGCAEGYYAVGLARALPRAIVAAFDIDDDAQNICRAAAGLNQVADRVSVSGLCTPALLQQELRASKERALLLLDCEGGEFDLLRPDVVPDLSRADILVECHDCLDRRISPALLERFSATHSVSRIEQGARDPSQCGLLRNMGEFERWMAVCEFRPEVMHWFFLTSCAREAGAPTANCGQGG